MVIQNQSHQWKFGDVGLTLRGDIQCERPKVLLILVMLVFGLAMAEVTERERERESYLNKIECRINNLIKVFL